MLEERGYPKDDFDKQAAAVSVDHPRVVNQYRHGHDMVHGNGTSPEQRTENLRQAMVDFRTVFEELVGDRARGKRAHLARRSGEPWWRPAFSRAGRRYSSGATRM